MKITKFAYILLIILINPNLNQAQIQNPRGATYNWNTDTTNKNVDLSEIILVLNRGAFPKLDYPKFINKEAGEKSFFKHEPVIAIEINGLAKAYPLSMLTMHEISNDTLAEIPILPTY